MTLSYRERLEAMLAEVAARFGVKDARGTLLTLELGHDDWAEMIGSSRPMVSRLIAEMVQNRVLAREGIELARAAVGDRYVLEEMLRSNNVLGGEQSGHVIFLDDSPAGDGLLTAVKIASLVSMNGRLESLITGLKDYPQTIVNVRVKAKPPLESLPQVSRALAEAQSALGDNGRVVLRYSGTEPLARVMVEAEHDADVQRYSQSVADALRESIGT